jgi:hypothetical protein
MEYFLSVYGRSPEFKRVLATYPWQEIENRFELKYKVTDNTGWSIKHPSTGNFVKEDYAALACAKYSELARSSFKHFSSQLQAAEPEKFISPEVRPWFDGVSEMLIRGVYTSKSTLFAWQILGCEKPKLPVLTVYKEKGVPKANNKGEFDPTSYTLERPRKAKPEQERRAAPPDVDSHDYELEEYPSMLNLGEEIDINMVTIDIEKEAKGKVKSDEDQSGISGGERQGSGKDTGRAIASDSPQDSRTFGAIEQIWNYLHKCSNDVKHPINHARWLDEKGDYIDEGTINYTILEKLSIMDEHPNLMKYIQEDEDDIEEINKIIRKINNWIHLNYVNRSRGGVLIKFLLDGSIIYIFEVERDIVIKKKGDHDGDDDFGDEIKESGPTGVIFKLNNQIELDKVKKFLFSEIRYSSGVMSKIIRYLNAYGSFYTFKHSKLRNSNHNNQYEEGRNYIKNALRNIGIDLIKLEKTL